MGLLIKLVLFGRGYDVVVKPSWQSTERYAIKRALSCGRTGESSSLVVNDAWTGGGKEPIVLKMKNNLSLWHWV